MKRTNWKEDEGESGAREPVEHDGSQPEPTGMRAVLQSYLSRRPGDSGAFRASRSLGPHRAQLGPTETHQGVTRLVTGELESVGVDDDASWDTDTLERILDQECLDALDALTELTGDSGDTAMGLALGGVVTSPDIVVPTRVQPPPIPTELSSGTSETNQGWQRGAAKGPVRVLESDATELLMAPPVDLPTPPVSQVPAALLAMNAARDLSAQPDSRYPGPAPASPAADHPKDDAHYAEAMVNDAKEAILDRDLPRAVTLLRAALSLDPTHRQARSNLDRLESLGYE